MDWQRHVHRDRNALAEAVAERIVALAGSGRPERPFQLALAGGRTPRDVYRRLQDHDLDWAAVEVWFGDERDVAPMHPDSNYRMAQETLLDRVPVPAERIHPMRTPGTGLRQDAARYARLLRTRLADAHGWPRFDLVLLGLGRDGHTASLFPHTCVLHQRDLAVAAVHVPQLRAWRMSLTLPVLEHAAHLLFLVSGADKAPVLRQAWDPAPTLDLPVLRIHAQGLVEWHVDRAAAGSGQAVPR